MYFKYHFHCLLNLWSNTLECLDSLCWMVTRWRRLRVSVMLTLSINSIEIQHQHSDMWETFCSILKTITFWHWCYIIVTNNLWIFERCAVSITVSFLQHHWIGLGALNIKCTTPTFISDWLEDYNVFYCVEVWNNNHSIKLNKQFLAVLGLFSIVKSVQRTKHTELRGEFKMYSGI